MMWKKFAFALICTMRSTASAHTIVTSIQELKTAILSDTSEVDIVSNLHFQQGDEVIVPVDRSVHIRSSTRAVLDGGSTSRFFTVAGSLVLDSLVLTHGAGANGGAIVVESNGSLVVHRTEFSYNHATIRSFLRRTEVTAAWGRGGAIYSKGSLVLDSATTFIGNAGQGGALWIGDTAQPPEGSEIEGTLKAEDVSFVGNKSPDANGGALVNYGASYLLRCLFESNVAETGGGAIFSHVPAGDGASAHLEVHGSSFISNAAGYGSSAIVVRSGTSKGDVTCDECIASRKEGGLGGGSCGECECNGCEGKWVTCAAAVGDGITRHMKTVWW